MFRSIEVAIKFFTIFGGYPFPGVIRIPFIMQLDISLYVNLSLVVQYITIYCPPENSIPENQKSREQNIGTQPCNHHLKNCRPCNIHRTSLVKLTPRTEARACERPAADCG